MRWHLIIFEVNRVVVRVMRGHKLSIFTREHVEEIMVLYGDDFSDEFTLVGRKGFGMQCSCWCGIVTDSSKRGPRRFSGGGFEMEQESSSPCSMSAWNAAVPTRLIRGGAR